MNIISLDLAKQLGVKVSGKRTMMAAFGGSVESASAVLDSIKLGALTIGRTEVITIGGGAFTNTKGGALAGILGWEFLSKLVVEVDYEHGRLNFYNRETYSYAGHAFRARCAVSGAAHDRPESTRSIGSVNRSADRPHATAGRPHAT